MTHRIYNAMTWAISMFQWLADLIFLGYFLLGLTSHISALIVCSFTWNAAGPPSAYVLVPLWWSSCSSFVLLPRLYREIYWVLSCTRDVEFASSLISLKVVVNRHRQEDKWFIWTVDLVEQEWGIENLKQKLRERQFKSCDCLVTTVGTWGSVFRNQLRCRMCGDFWLRRQ